MSYDIVVLVSRNSTRPVSQEVMGENYYLLKCPSVLWNHKAKRLMCQVRPENTVAWSTSFEGLMKRLPDRACIVAEEDYCKNFYAYAA